MCVDYVCTCSVMNLLFLLQSANFRLYENYCKNRSDSNALLQCSSACEAFLKVSVHVKF